jgi:hypothetical protein
MSHLFAAVILICFAASACDAEDQPQRRMALLYQLRNCLDKVPAQRDVAYTSPCAKMKVSMTARWRRPLFGLFISFLEITPAVDRNSPAFLTRNDAAERSSG